MSFTGLVRRIAVPFRELLVSSRFLLVFDHYCNARPGSRCDVVPITRRGRVRISLYGLSVPHFDQTFLQDKLRLDGAMMTPEVHALKPKPVSNEGPQGFVMHEQIDHQERIRALCPCKEVQERGVE